MKSTLKHILNSLCSSFGIGHIATSIYGGKGTILMFHRVLPKEKLSPINMVKGLEVSIPMFTSVLESYLESGYHPIGIDEIPEYISQDRGKKFFAVTFDDGYRDNLEYALPILRKLRVPSCIYICTCFPNRTSSMWWYGLQDIIIKI